MLVQVDFPFLIWVLACRQVFQQVQVAKEVLAQNSLMDLTFVILTWDLLCMPILGDLPFLIWDPFCAVVPLYKVR